MPRPQDPVPGELLRARRARVGELLDDGAMILPASPVRFASRDAEYPYRPDSELYWATGVTEPGAVAFLRRDCFVLFVPSRDPDEELWTGPREGPEGAADRFGADATWPLEELEERLPELLHPVRHVYFRLGSDERVEGLVRRALAWGRRRGPKKGDGPRAVIDPGEILDDLRLVKDDWEVARIREACDVTMEGFREMLSEAGPGVGEWELQATLEAAFRRGGEGPAYGTIVASGANACVLHYVDNRDRLGEGDLVLVDAGGTVGLYAGDVSRTFPGGGRFTDVQRAVYDVVEAARAAAVEAVEPGATLAGVHDAAVRVLVEGLVELDVLAGRPDALIQDEAHKDFFPHRTSHWLGLDVHDPGDYARDGRSRVLEPGMVLTVEPGLYFLPGSDRAPAGLRGIGVRIEDDVLVTEEGREVLTAALPTGAEAVEGLVGGGT